MDYEEEISWIKAFCKRWKVSQEITEIVVYLFKVHKASSYCFSLNKIVSYPSTPNIHIRWREYSLSFNQTAVLATLERQPPYCFVPRSVEHFKKVLGILISLPKDLDEETRLKAVAAAEAFPDASIEELLVLIRLKHV